MLKWLYQYQKVVHVALLVILYVGAMSLFVYLKLSGILELPGKPGLDNGLVLFAAGGMGAVIAILIGVLEFRLFAKWRGMPTGKFLMLKYGVIVLVITFTCTLVYCLYVALARGLSFREVLNAVPDFLSSGIFLSTFIYLIVFSLLLNVMKVVSEHLGPQALAGALLGTYDHPQTEDRTFIFIDLAASTTLAEKIGHQQYSLFIDRCFEILTTTIYEYDAVLYQFVGDEAVLSWKTKIASKTLAPVKLYFRFKELLEARQDSFMKDFGVIPRFKAAIHAGEVTVTVIRSTKVDIVYRGDVLNTCARMMEQASLLKKDLLVSTPVFEILRELPNYRTAFVSEVKFRGKNTDTAVYEVKAKACGKAGGSLTLLN